MIAAGRRVDGDFLDEAELTRQRCTNAQKRHPDDRSVESRHHDPRRRRREDCLDATRREWVRSTRDLWQKAGESSRSLVVERLKHEAFDL